jgi:PAS domain S-box-containing protein
VGDSPQPDPPDREALQAALDREQRRFRGLVNHLDHAVVWEIDAATGHVTFMSERAATLFGVPRALWLTDASQWLDRVHPEDRLAVVGMFRATARDHQDRRLDHRLYTQDGHVLWLHTGVSVAVRQGHTTLQGLSVDITPLKTAQQRLQAVATDEQFLAEAGAALALTLDLDETLQQAVRLALPRLADGCMIDLLSDDGTLQVAAMAHADPAAARPNWAAVAAERAGLQAVVASGQGDAVPDLFGVTGPLTEERRRLLHGLQGAGVESYLCLPLRARGRVIGTMRFLSLVPRRTYDGGDRRLAEDLAWRSAAAIDNARLYDDLCRENRNLRQMSAALQVRETMFRHLSENIAEVFWLTARDLQQIVYVSPAYETVWGRSVRSLLDRPETFLEAVHPEDRARVTQARERLATGTYDIEYRVVRPDGTVRWVRSRAFPVLDTAGAFDGVAGIAQDITEYRMTVDALKQAETRYRTILASVQDIVYVIRPDGTFVGLNPAFEAVTGWPTADWIGRSFAGIIEPIDLPATDAAFHRALAGETPAPTIARVRTRGGTAVPMEIIPAPHRLDDGQVVGVIGIARNVTDRLRHEQEQRLLVEEMQRAVHAREEVVSIVSHDLKNPLAAILMNAQLLARVLPPGEENPKARQRVAAIERSAERMNRLINDLLDVSRIRGGRLAIEPTDLRVRPLITEAIEALEQLAAEKSLHLTCRVPHELPAVRADRARILQVLANLIGNALKFTPPGGTIVVSARRQDGAVQITVQDTGPGIPAAQVSHLFERFWQAKETAHQGTGLGLTIAKGIIDAHDGRIWADCTPGGGCAFHFTLTLAAGESGSESVPAA